MEGAHIRLVDVHSHVLPAVDDGATSLDEALHMLRIAQRDGIETIVATPHVPTQSGVRLEPGSIRRHAESLDQLAREQGIEIRVLPGSELRLEPGLLRGLELDTLLSLNGGPYLLLELPLVGSWPSYVRPSIFELQLSGYLPILAHVERYPSVRRDPKILRELISSGVLMQVNSSSIAGTADERSARTSLALLHARMVHVIASDAHSAGFRAPRIRRAIDRVAELVDRDYADWIASVSDDVVSGNMVAIPEPVSDRKRRWWTSLRGSRPAGP